MTEELKQPWESAAVLDQMGIQSVWFANAADGIQPDDFQPPVPKCHPLRGLTLCHLVMREFTPITGTWSGDDAEARAMAWADAVSQI